MQINNINISGVQDVADSAVRIDQERIPETEKQTNFKAAFLKEIKSGSENYNKNSVLDDAERKSSLGINAEEQARTMKTEMIMALNSMSDADLEEIEKNGLSPKDMKPEDYVTIADKIRLQLSKAGVDVEAIGGLDRDTVASITNSETFAAVFEQGLKDNDLPTDEDILADGNTAFKKLNGMKGMLETGLSDETMTYLIKNELSPSIDNIFRATYAGTGGEPELNDVEEEVLPSIRNLVTSAGLPLTDEYMGNAVWLAERELPITEENLTYLTELNSIELTDPADFMPEMMESMIDAVSEGRMPQDAFMIRGYSLHDKAEEIYAVANEASDRNVDNVLAKGQPLTIASLRDDILYNSPFLSGPSTDGEASVISDKTDIEKAPAAGVNSSDMDSVTARRQLEEIRLTMTIEANYSLMKKGINVDTTELSELVEQLKAEEQAFTIALLSETGDTESYLNEKVSLYNDITKEINGLKDMPAAILGHIPNIKEGTIHSVTRMTVSYSSKIMEADRLYEAMHTEVRPDLGDTMGKAFRNTDEILAELDMEITPENERAIRILAYNEMPVSPENIGRIREADAVIQRTFKNMTPKTVADMIKAGENPLDMKIGDLNDMAESFSRDNGSGSEAETFAKFLWKAEHTDGISEEERNGLVGIFRLIHQVNKQDGAAIGMLIKQGADITLRNLMTAVRSRKAEGMDITVDDDFGLLTDFDRNSLTITEQIEMSFQSVCLKNSEEEITPFKMLDIGGEEPIMSMTPEELWDRIRESEEPEEFDKAYFKAEREAMKETMKAEDAVFNVLKNFDIPASAVNVEAMTEIMRNRNSAYETLKRFSERESNDPKTESVLKSLLEDDDILSTPEEMEEQAEKREQNTREALSGLMENEDISSMDLKALRLASAQMSVYRGMAGEETYNVPVTVGNELTNMTLKIVRGTDRKGLVDIALSTDLTGDMRASLRYESENITGSVFMSNRGMADLFESHRADFENAVREATGFTTEIKTGYDRHIHAESIFNDDNPGFDVTKEKSATDTATLYKAAKAFIDSVKELV